MESANVPLKSKFFDYKLLKRVLMVLAGSFIQAIALKTFMSVASIIPGGSAGLSILLQKIFGTFLGIAIPYSLLNISFNFFPALYAFFNLGKKFVILSIVAVVNSSLLVDFLPTYTITTDPFLNVFFGAILYGAGASVILNANACTGGTDFIAMSISNKSNKSIWNYVLVFNTIVYIVYGSLFGFQKALYSIVFQVIYTYIINSGQLRYQRKTVFIVIDEPDQVANELMELTGHGVTVLKGRGQYHGKEKYIIYMIIEKSDVRIVQNHIKKNFPHAFLNVTDSESLLGNFKL